MARCEACGEETAVEEWMGSWVLCRKCREAIEKAKDEIYHRDKGAGDG